MTRYLVTDTELQCAIHEAIDSQDQDPKGNDYVIESTIDVINHVLRLLDRFKVADSEQTENSKQDAGREIDTSEYPVILIGDIARNELVAMICEAYQKGKDNGEDSNER